MSEADIPKSVRHCCRPICSAADQLVEMGESRTPRPEPFAWNHYERVRWFSSTGGRPSAGFRPVHSRVPRSGLAPGYVTSPGLHLR
jgi:hypothetical protein